MNGPSLHTVLQRFPLLTALSEAELQRMAFMAERRTAHKHSLIYLADEPSEYICFLIEGAVKIGIYSPDGREIIKSIQHPYTVFGELAMALQGTLAEGSNLASATPSTHRNDRGDHCSTVFFLLILALAARSMAFFIHAASCVASSTTSAGTS